MADDNIKALIKRFESLQQKRSKWHGLWDDLARVMLPRRLGFATEVVPGSSRTEDIYDGTPMQAARGLSNAIGGMLRPDGQDWFSIKATDDRIDNTDEAKDWLADSENRLRAALDNPKARLRQATGEADMDLVVFGTAAMFVGRARNHLLFQTLHLKDVVIFFNEQGEPEGAFQVRKFTLAQARDRFGDALSEDTRRRIGEGKLDEEIRILRAVVPRPGGDVNAMLSRNLPFTDLHIEMEAEHLLETEGFHEFPFVVPRWDTTSGEEYGRSPGMIALPDANTLQAMGETMLIAGQRAADPPLAVPNDGFFNEANTFPGGLSYYDVETAVQVRGNPFFPIESGANLPLSREMQGDTREQIFAAYFRNVLNLPIDGPQMTATEVIQRKEEFIREIGPVFGRLETDYTAPMIERAFNIMLRTGRLAEVPEILQGSNVRFEYESPVKRIRQQAEAVAARQWAVETMELAQVKPGALDLINEDGLVRFTGEALGVPHEIINGNKQVQALREQRQAQVQAQQAAAGAQQVADTAKTGSEAINNLARTGQ